jgi:hypothetical protein
MVEQNFRKPFVNIDALTKEKKASMIEIGNLKRDKKIDEREYYFCYHGMIKHRSFVVIIL